MGDLIILTLDPEGADREEFLRWAVKPALPKGLSPDQLKALVNCTRRSLLSDPNVSEEQRQRRVEELRLLEARGVR